MSEKEGKLTKDELLDGLESMKGRALEYTGNYPDMTPEEPVFKQACTQLGEIVEEYSTQKETINLLSEQVLMMEKELQQQKLKVSREWIERCVDIMFENTVLHNEQQYGYWVGRFIDAGVEVEE